MSRPFRRVGNQAAVLSKLRFQVPNPSAKVRHLTTLAAPLRFRRSFQLRNARFNIFNLDGLGRVRHHAIGGSHSGGRRRVRVNHDLQQRRNCVAGGLLKPSHRLSEGKSPGLAIRGIKLGILYPAQEGRLPHADRTRGFLGVAMREQGRDGGLLLAPEFCPVAGHLMASEGF